MRTIQCVWCSKPYSFVARGRSPLTHPGECRELYSRASLLQRTREWKLNHRERYGAIARKSYTRVCVRCGAKRMHSGGTKKYPRLGFVCGTCKLAERRSQKSCSFCGREVVRPPSQMRSRVYHSECYGAESAARLQLHLTRERVRQLINVKLSAGVRTRKEALEELVRQRVAQLARPLVRPKSA